MHSCTLKTWIFVLLRLEVNCGMRLNIWTFILLVIAAIIIPSTMSTVIIVFRIIQLIATWFDLGWVMSVILWYFWEIVFGKLVRVLPVYIFQCSRNEVYHIGHLFKLFKFSPCVNWLEVFYLEKNMDFLYLYDWLSRFGSEDLGFWIFLLVYEWFWRPSSWSLIFCLPISSSKDLQIHICHNNQFQDL